MRNLIFILLISLSLPFCYANSIVEKEPEPMAELHLLEQKVDLGEFDIDSIVRREVKFINTGNAPLIIKSAFSNCGCTVADYPRQPIAPGDTASLTVTYKNNDKTGGHFRKIVRLRSNARTPLTSIYITGNARNSHL